MRLRILVNCIADQRPVSAGDVIEASQATALVLLQGRRAEPYVEPAEQAVISAPETAEAQPRRGEPVRGTHPRSGDAGHRRAGKATEKRHED
jgi:hypothetical protein